MSNQIIDKALAYLGEHTVPYVLYDNWDNAVDNASITLNDSLANYQFINIIFKDNDGVVDSATVYNPNGKLVSLSVQHANIGDTDLYIKGKTVFCNNNIISTRQNSTGSYVQNFQWACTNGSSSGISYRKGNYIAIVAVIGYK